MINFAFEMMNFVFKTMKFVLKMQVENAEKALSPEE